jgi:hypothetical protein
MKLIAYLIPLLLKALVNSMVLARIRAAVQRWESVEVEGKEKQQGVLDELRVIGIHTASWILTTVIDLVVLQARIKSGAETEIKSGA